MPSPSDTSVRVNPVAALFAVTVAPGTAAPWSSTMRPVMLPVVCCATAGVAASQIEQRTIIAVMIFFMPDGLRYWKKCEPGAPMRLSRY